jgi:LysM repeat protein
MIQQTQSVPQPGQQSAAPAPKEHVVVAGESLEQIARNYGVSVKHLRQLNKLSGPVQPGQKLRIPVARAAAASAPRPAAAPATATPAPAASTPAKP